MDDADDKDRADELENKALDIQEKAIKAKPPAAKPKAKP
jgi:hypothetical protein